MSVYLKVKVKSLMEEAHIIRHEKRLARARKRIDTLANLDNHNKHVVRPEARASHAAYMLARGRDPVVFERDARTRPDIGRVLSMLIRYASTERLTELGIRVGHTPEVSMSNREKMAELWPTKRLTAEREAPKRTPRRTYTEEDIRLAKQRASVIAEELSKLVE